MCKNTSVVSLLMCRVSTRPKHSKKWGCLYFNKFHWDDHNRVFLLPRNPHSQPQTHLNVLTLKSLALWSPNTSMALYIVTFPQVEAADRVGRLLGSSLVWEYSSSLSAGAQCPLSILYTDQEKKMQIKQNKIKLLHDTLVANHPNWFGVKSTLYLAAFKHTGGKGLPKNPSALWMQPAPHWHLSVVPSLWDTQPLPQQRPHSCRGERRWKQTSPVSLSINTLWCWCFAVLCMCSKYWSCQK